MMWDMNYFKYMFLKLIAVPFNERRLEQDFNLLADFLLDTRSGLFSLQGFSVSKCYDYGGRTMVY